MNLKRPPLPRSLAKLRVTRILKRLGICALLLAGIIVMIELLGEEMFAFGTTNTTAKKNFLLMFYLIPFLVTGVPFKLIDRSWSGTVIRIDVEPGIAYQGWAAGSGRGYMNRTNKIVLMIEKDNGAVIPYTVMSLNIKEFTHQRIGATAKVEQQESNFAIGDKVYKYYGFKHIAIEHKRVIGKKHCIVCGHVSKYEKDICWNCGSEFVGNRE